MQREDNEGMMKIGELRKVNKNMKNYVTHIHEYVMRLTIRDVRHPSEKYNCVPSHSNETYPARFRLI